MPFIAAQMIQMDCNQISVKYQPLNRKATQSLKSIIDTNTFGHKEYILSFAMN